MKLTFFAKPPQDVYLAFSGGVDSSVLLHNLVKRGICTTILHVHHNTDWCDVELAFAKKEAKRIGLGLVEKRIPRFDKSVSLESFWSKHRNAIFQDMDKPVLTGHILDDAIEWYLMSTCQGTVKLLNYQNRNVLRPLLGTRKSQIYKYAEYFDIKYLTDPTNEDQEFNLRNKVRHSLIPQTEAIFPGIATTVLRLIKDKESKLQTINRV